MWNLCETSEAPTKEPLYTPHPYNVGLMFGPIFKLKLPPTIATSVESKLESKIRHSIRHACPLGKVCKVSKDCLRRHCISQFKLEFYWCYWHYQRFICLMLLLILDSSLDSMLGYAVCRAVVGELELLSQNCYVVFLWSKLDLAFF